MPQRENEDGSITYYVEGYDPNAGEPGAVTQVESKVVDAPVKEEPVTATAETKASALAPQE